jgi:hypothetical protein
MKHKSFLVFFKKPFIALLALALLIAMGLFFWYEYRPSLVREKCAIEAEKMSNKDSFVYEIIYRHCLRINGIEYYEQKN